MGDREQHHAWAPEMAKWKDLSLSRGKNGSSRASTVLPGPSILWSPRPWLKTNEKGRLPLPDSVSPGFLGLGSRSGSLRNTAPSRETGTRQRQSASGSGRLEAQGFAHGEPEHRVPPVEGTRRCANPLPLCEVTMSHPLPLRGVSTAPIPSSSSRSEERLGVLPSCDHSLGPCIFLFQMDSMSV